MPSDSKKKRDAKKKDAAKSSTSNGNKAAVNGTSTGGSKKEIRELTAEGTSIFFSRWMKNIARFLDLSFM